MRSLKRIVFFSVAAVVIGISYLVTLWPRRGDGRWNAREVPSRQGPLGKIIERRSKEEAEALAKKSYEHLRSKLVGLIPELK